MSKPVIGIVIGTTRRGRFGERPAKWIFDRASASEDIDVELIDLRDYPMPLFDEEKSPFREAVKNEQAQVWCRKAGSLDGFIFVTPEYNRAPPAVLKNAIDHVYSEMHKKPVGFVSYGSVGGVRAVEQMRLICIELQMAPVRNAVHIAAPAFPAIRDKGQDFDDFPNLVAAADTLLKDMAWWAQVLKDAREKG